MVSPTGPGFLELQVKFILLFFPISKKRKMTGYYLTITAVVAVVGFAVYRYGHDISQIVAPKSTSADASVKRKDDDGTGIDSSSLIVTILKHHPKNMDLKRVGDVVKFIKDTVKGKPMNDRLLAVGDIPAESFMFVD